MVSSIETGFNSMKFNFNSMKLNFSNSMKLNFSNSMKIQFGSRVGFLSLIREIKQRNFGNQKNHVRNQTDKFRKSKNHLRNQTRKEIDQMKLLSNQIDFFRNQKVRKKNTPRTPYITTQFPCVPNYSLKISPNSK